MAVTDFAQVADPWLRILQDDPERSDPHHVEPTTFPLGGGELDGQVFDIVRASSLSDFMTFLFAFAVSKPSHETL